MRRIFIMLILIAIGSIARAQKPVIINVEKLPKPTYVWSVWDYNAILEHMILSDKHLTSYEIQKLQVDPQYNIVAKSNITDSLVDEGCHPFFQGMFGAYAEHRPFTLSPDMVWLLISQGFANHVNNNAESLRGMFVNFKGQTSLIVRNDTISITDPNSPWQDVFPEFSKQIATYTGKELTNTLTADFSTTTPTVRIASQITLMDATKSYFNYSVITISCGIPKVTLEGTPADWQKVLTKTEALRKYKLDWWVDKMEPVVRNIIAASQGKVDKPFWQSMFKYHSTGRNCGSPTIIDGWIVKFFPYNKAGKRNNLDSLNFKTELPDEIVKVDLKYLVGDGLGGFTTVPLELWAGFVGLKQNKTTFNLTPEIGWMIRKRDYQVDTILTNQLKANNVHGGIIINAKTFPLQLLDVGPIHNLEISFTDGVNVPDEISKIKIDNFSMYGTASNEQISRIKKLLPNTNLTLNGKPVDAQ